MKIAWSDVRTQVVAGLILAAILAIGGVAFSQVQGAIGDAARWVVALAATPIVAPLWLVICIALVLVQTVRGLARYRQHRQLSSRFPSAGESVARLADLSDDETLVLKVLGSRFPLAIEMGELDLDDGEMWARIDRGSDGLALRRLATRRDHEVHLTGAGRDLALDAGFIASSKNDP